MSEIKDFEDFMEAQKLREDVRIAEAEADAGLGIPHDQAVREMEALFKTFPEKNTGKVDTIKLREEACRKLGI